MKRLIVAALATAIVMSGVVGTIGPVSAAGTSEVQEENALDGAKLTLTDGVAIAEGRPRARRSTPA